MIGWSYPCPSLVSRQTTSMQGACGSLVVADVSWRRAMLVSFQCHAACTPSGPLPPGTQPIHAGKISWARIHVGPVFTLAQIQEAAMPPLWSLYMASLLSSLHECFWPQHEFAMPHVREEAARYPAIPENSSAIGYSDTLWRARGGYSSWAARCGLLRQAQHKIVTAVVARVMWRKEEGEYEQLRCQCCASSFRTRTLR